MRQGQVAALLTRLPANPQQERLLSSLAAAAGPLSAAVGCAGAASSRAGRPQQLSTLARGSLPAQPPHAAAMPSGTVLRPAGRLEPSLPHLGWSALRGARGLSAMPQVDATARVYSRSEEVVRPLHQHTKDQLSLKAQVIFEQCWKKLEEKLKDRYVCPREVVWLNGAPGSGKGTNMPFIMKSRGLSRTVTMSQLLDGSAEIKAIIDRAELVPDNLVLDALLDALLNPDINDGAGLVIDGFPRTALQVDFVKLLYDKLLARHLKHADGPDEWRFPRPSFKVVILYVDEEESVRRQMKRAQLASLHNKRVMDAGTGDVWDVRTTDINEALCRRRYQVFKAHYHTILRLKQYFPFSLIDAMGSLEDCRQQIMRELRYQSSLDLDEATYAAIRHLPLARDLVRVARQRLVFRLDSYCKRHNKLFLDVIKMIDGEVLPVLKQCSLAGHAEYKTRHALLMDNNLAVDMLIDVLSDRGFSVAHSAEERVVPERMDLKTGEIESRVELVHKFRITFEKENVRDLSTPSTVTTKQGEDIAIGTTFVPTHMQREDYLRQEEATVIGPHCVLTTLGPDGASGKDRAAAGGGSTAAPKQQQQQAGGGTQYFGGGGATLPSGESVLMEAPVLSVMPPPPTQRLPGSGKGGGEAPPGQQQKQQRGKEAGAGGGSAGDRRSAPAGAVPRGTEAQGKAAGAAASRQGTAPKPEGYDSIYAERRGAARGSRGLVTGGRGGPRLGRAGSALADAAGYSKLASTSKPEGYDEAPGAGEHAGGSAAAQPPRDQPILAASGAHDAAPTLPLGRDSPFDHTQFLSGWDSMDHELSAGSRSRKYGYELLNLDVPAGSSSQAQEGGAAGPAPGKVSVE